MLTRIIRAILNKEDPEIEAIRKDRARFVLLTCRISDIWNERVALSESGEWVENDVDELWRSNQYRNTWEDLQSLALSIREKENILGLINEAQ